MKIKRELPYIIFISLLFYTLPFLVMDTGSGMLVLLILIPYLCFLCSNIQGYRNGISLIYLLSVPILFLPSVLFFYNSSAMVYCLIYAVIALLGSLVGHGVKILRTKLMESK